MAILKHEEQNENKKIMRMIFPAFPEAHDHAEETDGEFLASSEHHDEVGAPEYHGVDLEMVRQEANAITRDAQERADEILNNAQNAAGETAAAAQREAEAGRAAFIAEGEQIKKDAYANGFSAGEETGFRKGYEDGFIKGKTQATDETRATVAMLGEAIEQLRAYRGQILTEAQRDIVKMALAVAEKVLHKEIMLDPASVISVVKNALKKVSFKKRFIVNVNPLDLEVLQNSSDEIKTHLDDAESLQFRADPKIEPGGCVVQTESGSVDARVDRQFAEISDSVLNALDKEE